MNSQSTNMALKYIGFEGPLVSHALRGLTKSPPPLNKQNFTPSVLEHIDRNKVRATAAKLSLRNSDASWCAGVLVE